MRLFALRSSICWRLIITILAGESFTSISVRVADTTTSRTLRSLSSSVSTKTSVLSVWTFSSSPKLFSSSAETALKEIKLLKIDKNTAFLIRYCFFFLLISSLPLTQSTPFSIPQRKKAKTSRIEAHGFLLRIILIFKLKK